MTRKLPSIVSKAGTSLALGLLLVSAVFVAPVAAQQQQQPAPPTSPPQTTAETPTITAKVEPQQISPNVPKTEILCSGVRREQRPVLRCQMRFDSQIEVVNARVSERGANPPVEWTASFRPTSVAEDDSAFFFLIDRTDTRRAATLRRLTQDLTEMLGRKGAQQQVAIATYSASLDVLANFTRESREATQVLSRVRADGVASEVFRLSIDAIRRLDSVQAGSKFLVIMSDGRADDTVIKLEDVAEAARKANVRIITIGYAESEAGRPDLQRLRVLALQTSGLFVEVPIRSKQIPQDVRQNLFQRFTAGGVLEAEAPGTKLPGAVEVILSYPNDRSLSFAAVLTDTQPSQPPAEQKPMVMNPDQAFEFTVEGVINWLFDPPWRALAAATVLSILIGGLILAFARRSARRKAAAKKVAAPRPLEVSPLAQSV
ncbi:MAG: VWA domain-containing protein, partial [Hyphomicrobiaceae bacterium]